MRLRGPQLQGNSSFRREPVDVSYKVVGRNTRANVRRRWNVLGHTNGKLGAIVREKERAHSVIT